MCAARINKRIDEVVTHRDLLIELERTSLALQANIHRDKKKHASGYTGRDFFKLSYEALIDEGEHMTGTLALPLMMERFKNKPLKKDSNGK